MNFEWSLEQWLTADLLSAGRPYIKVLFWALMGLLILTILRRSFGKGKNKTITRAYRIFFWIIAMMMVVVLAYQATWQLAGFARPEFTRFMQRYNRRPDNPAAKIVRGSILDRQGVGLAVSDLEPVTRRWYPGGLAFAHVVGYEHPFYGLSGVEAADHATLSGVIEEAGPEWEKFRRNLMRRDDIRGLDTTLTLHAGLQKEAHELMEGLKGAVVMLDPSDGAILVLYSAPGFDPNRVDGALFARRDPESRMLNRALHGLYPAGSTLKVLVAAAALEQGLNPTLNCPAEGYRVGTGNRPIRDHEYYDYQRRGQVWPGRTGMNMREALTKSSNVYFAQLGVQVGGERLSEMAARFGLTSAWTIFTGSSGSISTMPGKFPVLTNRDLARTAQVSIGQGEMVTTPLHMAVLAAVIGRQGAYWAPRLNLATPKKPMDPLISPQTARTLAGMMRNAVSQGSGRGAEIEGLQVAGKTGTAQNPHGADHGWFIGFAPADKPVLAFAVIVEQGGFGSRSAVPVAAGLLKKARALGLFAPGNVGARSP